MKVLEFVMDGYSIGLATKKARWQRHKNPCPEAVSLFQQARDLYFEKLPAEKRGGWG